MGCEYSRTRHIYSEEQIDNLLKDGVITKDIYDSYVSAISRFKERRDFVRKAISDRTYPFSVTEDELNFDFNEGLIDEDQYRIFSWYLDKDFPEVPENIVSVKLKLSVWGLRLPGRYDTFEHILDFEEGELRQRCYCIHGTLFEGCGNYKAPDASKVTVLPLPVVQKFKCLLSSLMNDGTLDKEYSTSPFNCGFFDLYIRTENGKIHTKGTTEFPDFIKFIMFILGAELSCY